MDKLDISNEEYKIEYCIIEEEECTQGDCRTCETAITHQKEQEAERKEAELEEFTEFTKQGTVCGLSVYINTANVIAKTDKATVSSLQEKGAISTTLKPYTASSIEQYPKLKKLQEYNSLGIPDELWTDRDKPGVFRYGETYFLIAPVVNSEECETPKNPEAIK